MAKKRYETVKGMSDILPEDQKYWKMIWEVGEDISEIHNFHYIETPVLEYEKLFEAASQEGGNLDDELIRLKPKNINTNLLALRPDGGIPIMRSYLEHQLGYYSSPLRAYYWGPMFRKRMKGRESNYEFHEWGFQIVGDGDPVYDAEIISAVVALLNNLKLDDPVLKVNAVGCKTCRPKYVKELKKYYRYRTQKLCDECSDHYKNAPLQLLTCESEECGELLDEAPIILDHLCDECNSHFKDLLELIEDNDINYIPDPYLVGKLSYYSRVAFMVLPNEESDRVLAGGGRCDYLAKEIGGSRNLETVHGALHLERIIKTMKEGEIEPKSKWDRRRKVFFVAVGKQARKSCLSIINRIRETRIMVLEALGRKSLKAQLRYAEQSDADLALIYGQKEIYEESIIMRDLKTGTQESILLKDMLDEVRDRL